MPATKNSRPEDTKQAVRMRRYYIAAFTSLLVLFLIFACSWLGFLDSKILVIAGLLILFFTALFYLLFRTQLNLKFSDPSLTAPQMLASSLTMVYVMHNAGAARGIFLIFSHHRIDRRNAVSGQRRNFHDTEPRGYGDL